MLYQKAQHTGEQELPLWPEDINPDVMLVLRTQEDVDTPVEQQVTIQDVAAKEEANDNGTANKGENDVTQIQMPAMPPPQIT
eukprot:5923368-Ditylum_brightwellii.AAC.2